MCQPKVADPREAGGPKLQTSEHQVAEVVEGVVNCPSLRDVSADTVDIPEGPAGGTLGDRPWRPANAVVGISSAVGFPAPLVEVATHIRGRNVKALIDCGSTSNYISDLLVPALGMEVILGTLWLIKENPGIDWVKPVVKMRRLGTITSLAIVERPRQH